MFSDEKGNKIQAGKIVSLNISNKKGLRKTAIDQCNIIENFGLENDVHGGPGLRQISLLPIESINQQNDLLKEKNTNVTLKPGDFAENITTEKIDFTQLKIGDQLLIDDHVVLELSKFGKECHRLCSIYYQTGDCIMPKQGVFAIVRKAGTIRAGSTITIKQITNLPQASEAYECC